MASTLDFKLPPVMLNASGHPRRVGFELEFSGLSLEQAASAILTTLGGTIVQQTAAEQVIRVDALGDFTVEIDWSYLKRIAAEKGQSGENEEWLSLLSSAASVLVPIEVVCPPIAIEALNTLQPMVAALRQAGAVGTEESLLAAYGVHINPELPNLDATTIFSYLRAFALLQWWLVDAHDVNASRKISPYIDLYSNQYIALLLSRSQPSMDTLFSDYLAYNASRNRALDLLPLFAEIYPKRLRLVVDDPRIKARPTFHYRLPNCNIEHEDWSLAQSWNLWWVVEALAQRHDDLDALGQIFVQENQAITGVNRKKWLERIDLWLTKHALV
ncbi:amidoligase family protein [Dasania sp. GY-MA-18]|uniref:Amidoligase family protein n=1 Tax=Dasania phycosphaerae TaxID=2950436 RepID=A0A9J6RPJ8_9GAMM|nr:MULTISPECIES: amidoligase family protein [Dasania]MCR8923832.1 amidoligase family protein [Dasania sp. GY-MA-18]MCZ0866266.1 amidoligase family protein [Dasania phycosphaerae]MCZ0869990.1 amidoligase family protein [Dasania phycosphaerae]